MRVDDDALRMAELGRDDVGRLPRHAWESEQLRQGAWHLSVELLEEHSHRAPDRLRLLPVEAGRVDVALELLRRHGQVVLGPPVLAKQILGDAVHVHVGRLCREHHGDEEIEVGGEAERDRRVGVLGGEPLDDRPDPLGTAAEPSTSGLADVATCHEGSRSARPPRRPSSHHGARRERDRRTPGKPARSSRSSELSTSYSVRRSSTPSSTSAQHAPGRPS